MPQKETKEIVPEDTDLLVRNRARETLFQATKADIFVPGNAFIAPVATYSPVSPTLARHFAVCRRRKGQGLTVKFHLC